MVHDRRADGRMGGIEVLGEEMRREAWKRRT
jgi:hypothetical protein